MISQFLAFIPWYRGLALGGIARVGQTQLLQPFLTIVAAALLLGEPGDIATWMIAALVVAVVAVGRTAAIPAVVAVGWLTVADPTRCDPPAGPPNGIPDHTSGMCGTEQTPHENRD